ncbi:putative transcription regulator mTERF family [Rosa chinensis]|uniref:Putative transcription regulator mTERF family n=2 Tax=Rosa chinensis TaxID=74649 RepID=A0A2P6PWJ5_ROSCH|nr:putative transcription regulator mTERF family [Rosa chinensis]
MAPHSIFSKSLRFCRVFYRNGHPVGGMASHFGPQKQLFCTRLTGRSEIPADQDDSTVSYLVNSCGLSPESATLVSHTVKLQSLEKPDSVLALLKHYEFSEAQISKVVQRLPHILLADVEQTLLPNLEFYCSIGMSRLHLARTLSYNPWLMSLSLKNDIVPAYSFFKSVVISDVKVIHILKHKSWIFRENLSKNLIPNIELVRELGIPQSCIALLLTSYTDVVMKKPELFSQLVHQVTEMGFDPQNLSFVQAIHALYGKETTWKRCQEVYRRWGWSENHIRSAFRVSPLCMVMSEKKLMGTMDFLVNKMGWQSQTIAKHPHVLSYSLQKRFIPRFSVVRVLFLKGLIEEENLSLATGISKSEKYFLDRFVNRYLSQVPQLLDVYRGKVDIQDVL